MPNFINKNAHQSRTKPPASILIPCVLAMLLIVGGAVIVFGFLFA